MFKGLSITACDTVTVRDLLHLKASGHCVYRTSHAGNWNIYKLLLSELGIPDCIWDVTCIYADKNNQPRHQLVGGQKVHLLGEKDPGVPPLGVRYLTPYTRVNGNGGHTLSHFHVEPLKKLFGDVVTTQSEVLLGFQDFLWQVFEVVGRYRPEWLGRYILPCGCMVSLTKMSGNMFRARCSHSSIDIHQSKLAESAMGTLEELKTMVLDSVGYVPHGGALYSFELVVASFYLWSYWQFGDKTIYELSGPDMIGYATKPDFISKVSAVLRLLGEHLQSITPERVDAKVVPTTFFRFGYPKGSAVSKGVMVAHDIVGKLQDIKRKNTDLPEIQTAMESSLRLILEIIQRDKSSWDLFHEPDRDAFYSQHDMVASGQRMEILDGFLDVSFGAMGKILRTLPQTESALARKFEAKPCVKTERRPFMFMEDSFL